MRPILWYLVLVGLPVAALFGIVELGERIKPPRAAHGQYSVTFDSAGSARCLTALVGGETQQLTISQSGPRLDVTYGPVLFSGTIAGDSIRAAAPIVDSALLRAASCLTADTVGISAAIAKGARATEPTLTGAFVFPNCATCAAVPFRAARLADSRHRGA